MATVVRTTDVPRSLTGATSPAAADPKNPAGAAPESLLTPILNATRALGQEVSSLATTNLKRIGLEEGAEKEARLKFLAVAIAVAIFAVVVGLVCLPAGIALGIVALWLLWSSIVDILHEAARGTSAEKTLNWLHAMTEEINLMCLSAGLLPFTSCDYYHEGRGNKFGQPIVLVHGYLSFASTWHAQLQQLEEAGLGPIYCVNISSFQSIEQGALELQKKVQAIQKATGRTDLSLIAHSKGGLVSAYYATQLAPLDGTTVTDLITLGSPLAGTPVAELGLGQDAREMTPGHPLNQRLRDALALCPEIRVSNIASETDEIVPLESALQAGDPSRHLLLKDKGHLGMLFSPKVGKHLVSLLRPGVSFAKPN
jgi:triacylglycerol lipase